MVPEVLLRPDLGKRPYRLKCRFITNSFPSERMLEKAKYEAAGLFVRDMAKQGWQHVDGYGFKMSGPFPATETIILPKRSDQERWHTPSAEILDTQGFRRRPQQQYATTVPQLTETDSWEFELAAVFIHDTLLTEVPDEHEEQEELTKR